ncbi:hypothetical protein B0O80DRAFT_427532 [Mortierella sp. GBAus27b]|nr:hypothetical protein B0O80DRAFT_427532 [Mortierella sp. GBAus27b]
MLRSIAPNYIRSFRPPDGSFALPRLSFLTCAMTGPHLDCFDLQNVSTHVQLGMSLRPNWCNSGPQPSCLAYPRYKLHFVLFTGESRLLLFLLINDGCTRAINKAKENKHELGFLQSSTQTLCPWVTPANLSLFGRQWKEAIRKQLRPQLTGSRSSECADRRFDPGRIHAARL